MLQQRYGQTPPQMAAYPWYNARLADLQSQLRRAKRQNPRSPEVRKLQRQYQTQLRHARTRHSQQEIQQEVLAFFVLCLWQAIAADLYGMHSVVTQVCLSAGSGARGDSLACFAGGSAGECSVNASQSGSAAAGMLCSAAPSMFFFHDHSSTMFTCHFLFFE
jgi:hypothetical protein